MRVGGRTLAGIVSAVMLGGAPGTTAWAQEIVVLSNRADLISGGDALVEIKWPSAPRVAPS